MNTPQPPDPHGQHPSDIGLLDLIGRHRDTVRAHLGDEAHALLLDRLRALADAPETGKGHRKALQGVRLALLPLPLDHPVRRALDSVRLAGAATPPTPAAARDLLERLTAPSPAAIVAAVRDRLLAAAPGLTPAELRSRRDDATPPADVIRLDGPDDEVRYPAFQFTPGTGEPRPVVREINRLLCADVDPWGAADWWLSGNTWLGAAPASLLGQVPDATLAGAARDLVEGAS